nr:RNA-directed DNA polymerase, eukaryota, reverse transcriptase zinc-binding domain protein [Tanacetum cinerariifolium]
MCNKLYKEKSHKSKRSLLAELADCDAIIDKGEGENNVVNERTKVVKLLQEVEKKNSLEAAQKAKIKWAIEGDENSKYYHGVINKKMNQLSIRGILVEGTWIDYPSLVTSEFMSHFKNRFEQSNSNRLHMNMHFLNTFSSIQVADLECQVSKKEIKKAVWDCGIDKSPGPDGFTFDIYRRYWKLIENVVVDAVACFFHQGSFPKGGNSSSIILIPKTPNANMVKYYRPISLIGSMYKIISKILENHLVAVLGGLVNEIQSNFVADKQILDVPKKVLHRMESMRSHFFNGAELSSKKSVWVKWKHALASKDKGGLGVSSLFALNRALMFKWKMKSCYPSLWLDIIHDVEMFKSRGIDLVSLIHSKLGNGANTSGCFVSFRRPPRGGVELQHFEYMKEKVEGCILADMMDRWFGALEGSGEFTITSVRKMIDDFMLPDVSSKTRWIKAVPIK